MRNPSVGVQSHLYAAPFPYDWPVTCNWLPDKHAAEITPKISVGGIPNSKEVCICKVDIDYHLFFAQALWQCTKKSVLAMHKSTLSTSKSALSKCKSKLSKYKKTCSKNKTILSKYESVLSKYKNILSKYTSILSKHTSTPPKHKSTPPTHKSTLSTFGTLGTESLEPGTFLIPWVPGTRFFPG